MNQSVHNLVETIRGPLAKRLAEHLPERFHRRLLSEVQQIETEIRDEDLLRTSRAGKRAIELARERYAKGSDDDIEIDEIPKVLEVDDGYWVEAWVWADKESVTSSFTCPHCGAKGMVAVEDWEAKSKGDNTVDTLTEYQCQDCGKSMWI